MQKEQRHNGKRAITKHKKSNNTNVRRIITPMWEDQQHQCTITSQMGKAITQHKNNNKDHTRQKVAPTQ